MDTTQVPRLIDLTDAELEIVDAIETELRTLKIRAKRSKKYDNETSLTLSHSRRKIYAEIPDDGACAMVLGLVRAYHCRELVLSTESKKKRNQRLFELLKRLARAHDPSFTYTSIQLNKNMLTKWHRDRRNVGESLCIGVGNFEGGGVDVRMSSDETRHFDNRRRWLKYDGQKYEHRTHPSCDGTRFAIIFYTRRQDKPKTTPLKARIPLRPKLSAYTIHLEGSPTRDATRVVIDLLDRLPVEIRPAAPARAVVRVRTYPRADALLNELETLEFDTFRVLRGKRVRRRGRHALAFEREARADEAVCRAIPYTPEIALLRDTTGARPDARILASFLPSIDTGGYTFERARSGECVLHLKRDAPLEYRWYANNVPVGERCPVELAHGELASLEIDSLPTSLELRRAEGSARFRRRAKNDRTKR